MRKDDHDPWCPWVGCELCKDQSARFRSGPCCDYHKEGTSKINGLIATASARVGKNLYDGRPFEYCPWCGKNIKEIKN